MKKPFSLLLIALLIASGLAGCVNSAESIGSVDASTPAADSSDSSSSAPAGSIPAATGSSVLIVYYSLSGTTENVAKKIEAKTGGTLYLLEPETSYGSTENAGTEMQAERDEDSIRELNGPLPDLSGYDTILIGGPVWSGEPANPIQKYLSQTDFEGKTVSGFWSASSNPANYADVFASLVQNGTVLDGLGLVSSDISEDSVLNSKIDVWLDSLGISNASA